MGRWDGNARERLERAADELFAERGYDASTVAEIAARAGLTERTFFRHFADKREVVFGDGGVALRDAIARAVDGFAASGSTLEAVRAGVEAAARFFHGMLDGARVRSRLIAGHADLRERAVMKRATLVAELAAALRRRGAGDPAASLGAEIGIAVFYVAFDRWVNGPQRRELVDIVGELFAEHAALAGDRRPLERTAHGAGTSR